MSRKIYVASSWRNTDHPVVLTKLREAGHEVFDYRENGFSWREISPEWRSWTAKEYIQALKHPIAIAGFDNDYSGMLWADVGLLLLTSGRSAHLELGWMAGVGKYTLILTKDGEKPELMALLADKVCNTLEEALENLA